MYVLVRARNVRVHVAASGSVKPMTSTSWDGTIWMDRGVVFGRVVRPLAV